MSDMNEMILQAPAKLNLYLDITGRRDDGYHLLETVMTSIDLCDRVTVRRSGKAEQITVECSNANIPQNEGNICHKAARLFFKEAGISDGSEIYIEKNIPSGAGMGGGSADAAAVLVGLNALYEKPLRTETLLKLASKIGADVPFCLVKGTKLCRGIGEKISECPGFKNTAYLIIKPSFSCDTKSAYERYDEKPLAPKNELNRFFAEFPRYFYNVFEELYQSTEIFGIKERLIQNGALGASLTGSGAAVFGAFETRKQAETARKAFSELSGVFTAIAESMTNF